ncbi:MAG: AAA family ATPase, partial [Spirochaetota bacterium]|nr:AAA family ATPase [Spirochaetota bacterium]
LISWNERNAEIEYVVPVNQEVIPVEIKSGKRTKSQSLSSFRKRYNPGYTVQITTKELYTGNKGHINIPLYYAGYFKKFIPTD